jgi:serine/threonine protein kinase
MRAFHHPNITKVYAHGRSENGPFMVMEYVNGIPLTELIAQSGGTLPYEVVTVLFGQLLSALSHAHEQHTIHRDLKPDNITINRDGNLKLMDFGIAKVLGEKGLTRTGMVVGTADYMSPEQVTGQALDTRSDLFCAGLIAYSMITGKSYYRRPSPSDTMLSIAKGPPPRIFETHPSIPPALEESLRVLLQQNINDRADTATDALRILTPALENIELENPSLIIDFIEAPESLRRSLQQRHAFYFYQRALALEHKSPQAAALFLYRSCLTDQQAKYAIQKFQSICAQHRYNFAAPQEPRARELEEQLKQHALNQEALQTIIPILEREGNWHRVCTYLRRLKDSSATHASSIHEKLLSIDPDFAQPDVCDWIFHDKPFVNLL